jgi:hypothetical protein
MKVPAFTRYAKKTVIDDVNGLITTLRLVLNNEPQQLILYLHQKSSTKKCDEKLFVNHV